MAVTQGLWATSFIYKQDLTSYYMNNALRSTLRPGIYDANIAIHTGKDESNNSTLYIDIKKGTTFIFSNDYVDDEVIGKRRNIVGNNVSNWSTLESSQSPSTMFKCVALNDFKVPCEGTSDISNGTYFIHAYINYNKDESTSESTTSPHFLISTEGEDVLYKPSNDKYEILDGADAETSGNNKFFLCVGVIRDGKLTGRGLPEYRHSATVDSSIMTPDLIVYDDTHIGFDIPRTFIGNTIYSDVFPSKHSNPMHSWEGAYLEKYKTDDSNLIKFEKIPNDCEAEADLIYATVESVDNVDEFDINSSRVIEYGYVPLDISKFKVGGTSVKDYLESTKSDCWPTENDEQANVMPLDICMVNINRLLPLIEGKRMWSYVVNKVREESSADDFTDIIPLAVVFRTDNKINPTNIISYFDLEMKMARLNSINVKDSNVFNIIPVIS